MFYPSDCYEDDTLYHRLYGRNPTIIVEETKPMTLIPSERNKPQLDPHRLRVVVYGPPKVGKSTFATRNPKALVIDTDNNGTEFLDCHRVSCNDWDTLKKILAEAKDDVRFNTIVIDTIDRAHQLCREAVCKANGIGHESEDKVWGRGWDLVKAQFNSMIAYISQSGKGLWMISHAQQKEVKIGKTSKNVTTTALSGKPGQLIMAVADVILYMDSTDTGRILKVIPEESLECGDRTKALTADIAFTTEQEAYNAMMAKFEEKKNVGLTAV